MPARDGRRARRIVDGRHRGSSGDAPGRVPAPRFSRMPVGMVAVVMILLLACAASISASETALFALSRQSLHEFGRSPSVLYRRAFRLMQHPGRVLMTVLISNTTVNVSFYTVSFIAFEKKPAAAATALGAATLLLLIIVGEMLPKALALANARLLAPFAAAWISILQAVLGPFTRLLSAVLSDPITRLLAPAASPPDAVDTDELQLLVEHSARAGHIDTTENELLQSIVTLPDASVREVMTPRVDVEFLRISDEPRRIQQAVRGSSRRILPICGRDLDDVRGLLVARDALLNPAAPLATLLRPARFVPEQVNLAQLVRHFHETRSHFAIVVDEYGGSSGLVTVDDIVEWIVGDLPEGAPSAEEAAMEQVDADTYRLAGDVSVRDWAERFAVEEVDRRVDTLAGLILDKLGRLPRPGDSIRLRNLTLTVESVRRRRIDRVLIRRTAEQRPVETQA